MLAFPGLAPGSVTDPRSAEAAVAQDIEAFLGVDKLSKVTELPLNGGPDWALNITVNLVPDGQNAVRSGPASNPRHLCIFSFLTGFKVEITLKHRYVNSVSQVTTEQLLCMR